jgi:serine/threonine protein kinase
MRDPEHPAGPEGTDSLGPCSKTALATDEDAGQETAPFSGQRAARPAARSTDPPEELADHPRYHVLGFLGRGGMGTVYRAEHRLMGRPVALKIISPHLLGRPAMAQRFLREVRAAARLDHPNIVQAYDADRAGDTYFLVMEFVEGVNLDQVLAEQGRLPCDRACDYARQCALGLQHAHEQGMVHRDIKPHNLMLTPQGQVKILDFGLARHASEAALEAPDTSPGPEPVDDAALTPLRGLACSYLGLGTADYVAPESAVDARRADIRADIYSLGCTLYHFLTGRVPFPGGNSFEKIAAHREQAPTALCELRPEAPEGLEAVVARLMAKAPASRPQTPAEAAAALAPFALPARQVLVVDDDPAARDSLRKLLEREGYTVATAADGREALARLRAFPLPDLILLDLLMPVMDGWEFLREQRHDPALASVPVVVISGTDPAPGSGLPEFLRKPLAPDRLVGAVRRHAEKTAPRAPV